RGRRPNCSSYCWSNQRSAHLARLDRRRGSRRVSHCLRRHLYFRVTLKRKTRAELIQEMAREAPASRASSKLLLLWSAFAGRSAFATGSAAHACAFTGWAALVFGAAARLD